MIYLVLLYLGAPWDPLTGLISSLRLLFYTTYQIPQLEFQHSFHAESTNCPIFKSLQFLDSVYSPGISDLCEEVVYSENL